MKKIYSMLTLLILSLTAGLSTATAQDDGKVVIELNADNGEWTASNAGKTWHSQWTSTSESPRVTLSHSANNMNYYDTQHIQLYTVFNGNTPQTYTVAVEGAEYYISRVSLDFVSSNDEGVSVSIYGDTPVENYSTEEPLHAESVPEIELDQLSSVTITVAKLGESNNFVHTSNFQVELTPRNLDEVVKTELDETYSYYSTFIDNFLLNTGTDPACYSPEAVEAFEAALNAYTAMDDPLAEPATIDEMRALNQLIKDTYEAVIASRVPFTFTDGYYRLRAAMEYTETTEVENENGEPEAITTHPVKYLTVGISKAAINATWGTPADLTTDCTALWQITNRDGLADIVSAAADARFTAITTSQAALLSQESDSLMAIDPVITLDGTTYVNIRVASQAQGGYFYIHQGGHASGAGKAGNIVGWSNSYNNGIFGGSEWVLEPVDETDALAIIEAYQPIKNHALMVEDYKSILANAKAELRIAKDLSTELNRERPLILDAAQLSSANTEVNEGTIEALIDNDASTYWHSQWNAGPVAGGTHYLQVELVDQDVVEAAFEFTRRAVANDHITEFGVYGTNDPDATKDDTELLATIETPFTVNTETLVSTVFPVKGYTYLRFYINATTTGRGYGHMAEFQLYPAATNDPATSQYHMMGSLATTLEQVLEQQAGVDPDEVTVEQYTTLREAYEAFKATYVDPTALRNAIADVAYIPGSIVEGDKPGQWTTTTSAQALATALAEAEAYDQAGVYTEEKSNALIESLNTLATQTFAEANGIKDGKWYRIRFAPQELFEENDWDLVAGNAAGVNPEMFGKYLTVFDVTQEGDELLFTELEPEEIVAGNWLHFIHEDDVNNADLSLFRFIPYADTTYVIQNKATGLFIRAAGTSGVATLSPHPSLFNTRAIGYGLSVVPAQSLFGDPQSFLHAQVSYNVLVTWNVDYAGSRSGFIIEEADDVEADYDGTEFNMNIAFGAVNTFCFPVTIEAQEGQIYVINDDAVDLAGTITLVPVGKVEPARPFIYINGTTDSFLADEDPEPIAFKHGYDITAAQPDTTHILRGTYTQVAVDRGTIIAKDNALVVNKDKTTTVGANHAYIVGEEAFDTTLTFEIVIDANGEDGISTAIATLSRPSTLFTIDGKLLNRHATLNDVRALGRGIYILGGMKVTVK